MRYSLDSDCEEEFLLYALHCNIEEHKLAFLINKNLGIKLKRRERDLDFFSKEGSITYPIFEFIDPQKEDTYYLVNNICKTAIETTTSAGSLFQTSVNEKTHYLIPEYRKADYLLKVTSDEIISFESFLLPKLVKLPFMVTAYAVDHAKLKSRTNLNFD
ncbi:MAG: IPExxxVDY family protein [Flavobacteriaceae bacterium]